VRWAGLWSNGCDAALSCASLSQLQRRFAAMKKPSFWLQLPFSVLAFVGMCAAVASAIPIHQSGVLVLLASALPWLFIFNVLGLALSTAIQRDVPSVRKIISLAIMVMALWPLGGRVLAGFAPQAAPEPGGLRVMSFNIWGTSRALTDERLSQLSTLIAAQRPHVLLLQELDAPTYAFLSGALEADGLAFGVHDPVNDLAVLSVYPVRPTGVLSDWTRLLQTEIETPQGPVAAWSIHAYRPDFAKAGIPLLAYGGRAEGQPDTAQQIDRLHQLIELESRPLLLGGDLNVPYLSPDHRWLGIYLTDTHLAAGRGPGFGFPASTEHARPVFLFGNTFWLRSPIRLVKLDHLFVSRHFAVREAETLDNSAGSDHAPVTAHLDWTVR
jgi:endonuclease/exonuclease/phosphatase (EEP) superfamily protein YafD